MKFQSHWNFQVTEITSNCPWLSKGDCLLFYSLRVMSPASFRLFTCSAHCFFNTRVITRVSFQHFVWFSYSNNATFLSEWNIVNQKLSKKKNDSRNWFRSSRFITEVSCLQVSKRNLKFVEQAWAWFSSLWLKKKTW